MKKKIGKLVLHKLRNEGWLNDKASFEKIYKKVEQRLENEANKLKKKNNEQLMHIDATFFNVS
jgi:ribosomal protein S19E (S16A)